jgi:hypothetical protein
MHHRSSQIDGAGNGGAMSDRRPREESGRRRRNLRQLHPFNAVNVRTRPNRSSSGPRLGRRARRASGPAGEATSAPAPAPHQALPPQARERAAGGPEDRASYRCSCGFLFEASVSTSVDCPHCGDTQAW